jgi:hypothetical protein
MDVFFMELGIRLSFVKISEFQEWGGFETLSPRYTTATQQSAKYTLRTMLSTVLATQFDLLSCRTTHDENIRIAHTSPSVRLTL